MNFTKRQQEILDTAISLTASGGLQNLTIRNIANAIGVSEPAVYRHFAGKAEIMKSMIMFFDSGIDESVYGAKGFAGIKSFVMARLQQAVNNPALSTLIFSEYLFIHEKDCAAVLMEMMHRHKRFLENKLQEAAENGEVRTGLDKTTIFRMIAGSLRLLVTQWNMSGRNFDIKEAGNSLLTTLEEVLQNEKTDN